LHNPKDGIYNFEGIADLEKFLKLAIDEDFYVILRPGPYISAGIDNGGIPYWLATKYPDIKLRSTDPNFLAELDKWFLVLMPKVQPFLLENRGKILMIEVEHEYGALNVCDEDYKTHMKTLIESYVGSNTILFTTDRPKGDEMKCGFIEDVFATTNFGTSDIAEIGYFFVSYLREVQAEGPLMNSQLFTGDTQHWQKPLKDSPVDGVSSTILNLLLAFDNFNIQTFQSSTNFGFWSGAVGKGTGSYTPLITNDDINAPLDEIGNPRATYETIADALSFVSLKLKTKLSQIMIYFLVFVRTSSATSVPNTDNQIQQHSSPRNFINFE
jgi:beta-galactosidase